MFGHQDDQDEHHDQPAEPMHDGVLGSDDNGSDVPTVVAPSTDEPPVNPALPGDMDNFGAPSDDAPVDDTPVAPAIDSSSHEANDLLDIKQQALQQLSPLVDHLDQTPEEKFRTTMMMIQASDDQSLVKVAYDAAKQIGDEKTKAQALLDIVNEINYFTHPQDSQS